MEEGSETFAATGLEIRRAGLPVLLRKERREYTEPGVYELTVSEKLDGEWRVVERRVVRE